MNRGLALTCIAWALVFGACSNCFAFAAKGQQVIPPTQAGQGGAKSVSEKPLTVQLRHSFGNMHDVVSESAFIKTVMANGLTMAQLEDHLEQRALVHESIDRILRNADLDAGLYGSPEREVLTLLRRNMQSLGVQWPRPSSAWPLTRGFLQEIKDSTQAGPYFALGVFHVYYGGITHGGRDIGAMIDRQLKTNLTYYTKSGGYEEYARAVDGIMGAGNQLEMIRGADEAYRYIIAVNNLEVFKTKQGLSPAPFGH